MPKETGRRYDPSNWYWQVGGDEAQLYSSDRRQYVALPDAVYDAWLAAGNVVTLITTEAELWDVLRAVYPAGLPPDVPPALRGGAGSQSLEDLGPMGDIAIKGPATNTWERWTLNELLLMKALFVREGVLTADRADEIFSV